MASPLDIRGVLMLFEGNAASALAAIEQVNLGLDSVERHVAGASGAMDMLGKAVPILAGVGLAVAGASAVSLKLAADFDASMTMIHTQAGAFDEDLGSMKASLMAMSGEVATTPDQLAQSLYHAESAGFRGKLALDMVRQAAELATIGHAGLERSTQAIIGVMAAYAGTNLTAADAAAQLNAIVGTGDMRMEQLTAAMTTGILPAAATFGLSLKDVGAALATLTDNVTPADEAATRLRMTFSLLGAPSGAAQQALGSLGIDATKLAYDMRQPNGLLKAVGDLRSHLGHIDTSGIQGGIAAVKADMEGFGFTTAQANQMVSKLGPDATEQAFLISKAFGGGRSSAAIMTLLTEFDRFQSKYDAIDKSSKKFADQWKETQSTFNYQAQQFRTNLDVIAISWGERLLPVATRFLGFINGLGGPLRDLMKSIGAGDTGFGLSQFFTAILGVDTGNKMSGLMHSVGDLIDAIVKGAPGVLDMASALGTDLLNAISQLVPQPLQDLVAAIHDNVLPAMQWFKDHGKETATAVEAIAGGWVAVKAAMTLGALVNFIGSLWEAIRVAGILEATMSLVGLSAQGSALRSAIAWITASHVTQLDWLAWKAFMVVTQVQVSTAAIVASVRAWVAWQAAALRSQLTWLAWKAIMLTQYIDVAVAAVVGAARSAAAWVLGAVASGAAWVASTAATVAAWIAATAVAVAQAALAAASWVIAAGAMVAVTLGTYAWTAAQWLLNVALDANPIGIIIVALAALVLGLIYAYQHSATFRSIVNQLWGEVQTLWGYLTQFAAWLQATLGPIFQDLSGKAQALADAFNAINPWSKHSPSLVENVTTGTRAITDQYEQMVRKVGQLKANLGVEVSARSVSVGAAAMVGAGAGGDTYQVQQTFNTPMNPQQVLVETGFALRRLRRQR